MSNTIKTNLFVFQGQLVPLLDWVGFPDLDLWFATEPVDRAAGPTWTWNRQSRHHFPLLAGCHCSLDSFCLWHRTLASIDVHKEPVWRILISSMLYSGETSLIFMSYRYRNLKKFIGKKLRLSLFCTVKTITIPTLDSFLKKLGWDDCTYNKPPGKKQRLFLYCRINGRWLMQ